MFGPQFNNRVEIYNSPYVFYTINILTKPSDEWLTVFWELFCGIAKQTDRCILYKVLSVIT
jgi:hypothetical protein